MSEFKQLNVPESPNLPLATNEFSRVYFDQYSNVLRLYFNRLRNALQALFSPRGGKYLSFPYGAFSSTTTQNISVIDTPTRVALDTTDYANGTYFVAGDGIHVEQSGIYNVQFSIQVTNDHNQDQDMAIWLRKGVGSGVAADIPYTSSVVTIAATHGGQPGYFVLAANFYVSLNEGDYIEFWWAANHLLVSLNALPPITSPFVNPGAPSVVVTTSYVSSLP